MASNKRKKATTLGTVAKHITSFVDNTKKIVQHHHSTPIFEDGRKYSCFWCSLPVDSAPIGCPIRQVPVFSSKKIRLRNNEEYVVQIAQQENRQQFMTEKVFCSFNCVRAFIDANSWDDYYINSARLLALMYSLITDTSGPVKISPAPCKSVMIQYGGNLTPEQYRTNFERVLCVDRGRLAMFPISQMYEEVALI